MKITINAHTLTVKEFRQLQRQMTFDEMLDWLSRNSGMKPEEFEALSIAELAEVIAQVKEAVESVFKLPKANASN